MTILINDNISIDEIIQKNLKRFEEIVLRVKTEDYGIFPSEALLMLSLIDALNCTTILESGRARGYSTRIFAEFFIQDKISIFSIDIDKDSKDAKYAESNLKQYKNLNLLYGDSIQILPQLIKKDTAVFIDGPKNDSALLLAINCLKNKNVKVVFIHDLRKTIFQRDIAEMLFPAIYFADDEKFLEKYNFLNKELIPKYNPRYTALGVIVNTNGAMNIKKATKYQLYQNPEKTITEKLMRKLGKYPLILKLLSSVKKVLRI